MKKIILVALLILLATPVYSATRRLYENFDDQVVNSPLRTRAYGLWDIVPPQHSWQTGRGGTGYCFSSGTIHDTFVEWVVGTSWYTNELYFSYYLKYPSHSNDTDGYWNAKFEYLTVNSGGAWESCAYGHGPVESTGASFFTQIRNDAGTPVYSADLGCLVNSWDTDWHHYEFYINRTSGIYRFWYDGTLCINQTFGQIWSGSTYTISTPSIDASPLQNVFTRSIDDLEIWDGMPTGGGGATYYIDPAAANDSDTGLSTDHPWKTLGAHTGTLATSDDVYFKAGSTITENSVTWPVSGTSGDRCIIGYYGVGAIPIWIVPNNQESGLMLEQESYVTIQDIEFNGGKATTPGNFLRVHIPNELIIQRCTFESDDVYNAVYLWNNTASSTSANILIDLCTFTSTQVSPNQNYGIRVSIYSPGETINNVTVQNCTFERWRYAVYFVDTNYTDYVFLNNKEPYGLVVQDNIITNCTQAIGYTLGTVDQANHPSYIRRNTITDTGSMTVGTDPEYSGYTNALQIQHCDGLVIEYNTIHGVLSGETGPVDGHGICIDWGAASNLYPSQNCIIRNNDISDCLHAGINAFKSTSGQYYNNYIHDCTNYGVLVDAAINTGNLWYNNTIVNNAVHGFRIGSSTELVPAQTLRNNIITGSVIGLRVRSDETFPDEDYNSFYNNTYNYRDSDNVDHSLNTHDITGNPLLTGYVLGTTSPCINTGVTLADVTTDIRGVTRPKGTGYDIGAYEYNGFNSFGTCLSGVTYRAP